MFQAWNTQGMGCSRPGTPKAWHVPGLEHAKMAHPGTEYANMVHPGTEYANMAHPNMEDACDTSEQLRWWFCKQNILNIMSKSMICHCFGPTTHQNEKRGLHSGCHGLPELKKKAPRPKTFEKYSQMGVLELGGWGTSKGPTWAL